MTNHADPIQDERLADRPEEGAEERADRPDLIAVRGNQDVEHVDVERGEGKLHRISGN